MGHVTSLSLVFFHLGVDKPTSWSASKDERTASTSEETFRAGLREEAGPWGTGSLEQILPTPGHHRGTPERSCEGVG